MSRGVFVTGTDTGSGKTHVCSTLLRSLGRQGLRVAGFKPVAAGAEWVDGDLQNDDAMALRVASNVDLAYPAVNPYCFEPPVSPHLAAAEAGVRIDTARLRDALEGLLACCDFVVAEGAGGWRVPLGDGLDIAGLAQVLDLPVVLVVGLRLGCLNHAQLSEQAIVASGMPLRGWIATQVDPGMDRVEQNLESLRALMNSPCLGILPHPAADPALDRLAFLDTVRLCC